ncbi:3440_t:CDS:2, partial [Funneliformis geosporum]
FTISYTFYTFPISIPSTLYQAKLFDIFKRLLSISQNELNEYLAISQLIF